MKEYAAASWVILVTELTPSLNVTGCLCFKFLCVSLSIVKHTWFFKMLPEAGTACVNNCIVLTIVVEDVFKLSIFLRNAFCLVILFIPIKDMN